MKRPCGSLRNKVRPIPVQEPGRGTRSGLQRCRMQGGGIYCTVNRKKAAPSAGANSRLQSYRGDISHGISAVDRAVGDYRTGPAFSLKNLLLQHRRETLGRSLEDRQFSEIKNDHMGSCPNESATAIAFLAPNGLAGFHIGAGQFGGSMSSAVHGIEVAIDQDPGIEVPLQISLMPDVLGTIAVPFRPNPFCSRTG